MKPALAVLSLMLLPLPALAHAGDRAGPGLGSLVTHALAAPDHALALMAVILVPLAVWLYARRRG
jgi:hydrogenase/urease accessory protein HupE